MAEGILSLIGHTPILELERAFNDRFRVFAKLEAWNPGGSAKDRPALAMIEHGLETGEIRQDTVLIESSSGNMGIGLAQACRRLGLRFICVVDPRTAVTNLRIMRAYGAEIDYVAEPDPATGDFLTARLHRVQELLSSIDHSVWTNQYANRHNAAAHYRGTVREIVDCLHDRLDYLFVAVSTCGTLRGCGEFLREVGHPARLIAVDAEGSVIFGDPPGKRVIPGLGAGIVPGLYEPALVDGLVHVTGADCVAGCRWLAATEAILVGGSAGGVASAVRKLNGTIPDGAVCAAIFHDRGERYLDTIFNDIWVEENFGASALSLEPYETKEHEEWTMVG